MDKLIWNKDIFGSRIDIHQGTESVGFIQWQHMLGGKARAEFNGRIFFLRREIFNSKIEIYDSEDKFPLAGVMVSIFNPCTDVIVNGKRFELEVKNFWQSRWSWKFNGSEIVTFVPNDFIVRGKGDIELFGACKEEMEILILLGLFVRNQFIILVLFFLLFLLLILF